jgi:hypoxanthine phosphoribosyltransferase
MSSVITIKNKQFKPYISADKIKQAVNEVASNINKDLNSEFPLFLVVLNGSFMFAADLLREINIPCEISFVKLASYHGTVSTGEVNELIGLKEDVRGRTVVIVEDIVDTGNTIEKLYQLLQSKKAGKIKVATALFKPDAYDKNFDISYCGLRIKNEFVLGYGLDYDGQGRNLKDIYILAQ